jgi:hypothetical protein
MKEGRKEPHRGKLSKNTMRLKKLCVYVKSGSRGRWDCGREQGSPWINIFVGRRGVMASEYLRTNAVAEKSVIQRSVPDHETVLLDIVSGVS